MGTLTELLQPFIDLLTPCVEFLIWSWPLKIYRLHNGERGVIKTFGKVYHWRKPEKTSGIWICFMFEEMDVIQAIGGYIDFDEQALTTKDQKIVLINSAVEYDIFSVKDAILETEDIEMLISGKTMNEIREYARAKNNDELFDSERMTKELSSTVNKKLKKNGVRIRTMMITDLRPHETTYVCDKIEQLVNDSIKKFKKEGEKCLIIN